ncbi:MAG: transposase [bacterium]|nr:transposase [bacterium]
MTNGLQGAYAEAMASVAESPTKHLDETTRRESGVLAWAWVAVGEAATAFLFRNSRQATVAHELVGDKATAWSSATVIRATCSSTWTNAKFASRT